MLAQETFETRAFALPMLQGMPVLALPVMPTVDHSHRLTVVVEAPAHPVPQLQGPFEESMFESQSGQQDDADIPLDATSRRTMLLEAPTYQRVIAGRWKQRHGEKYHPLWKLVAQMSFGVHLLAENMARSQEDVFQILQTHVDDIDVFLERTTEDFTLAKEDIQERLKCLELPLQHPEVFDRMLEDRTFRNNIVEGNEKIEHIITRTGCAMKDALKDVQKGFDSTSTLERYLHTLDITWARATPEHEAVFLAMLGNVEGWKKAFMDLHQLGHKLGSLLRKLTDVVNQMQQRAGEVSRRLIIKQQRQGTSDKPSNGITYVSRQPPSSRSSSRQQATPPPLVSRKPLPAASSTGGERQHSRTRSREQLQSQRVGTSQSQYSITSQGARSNGSRTETPVSRTQSQNGTVLPPVQDQDMSSGHVSGQRVAQVRTRPEHSRTRSQTESAQTPPSHIQGALREQRSVDMLKLTQPRPQIRGQGSSSVSAVTIESSQAMSRPTRVFAPVELPAELPSSAFLQAPMSSTNRFSTGLGILPSERRAQSQSKAFNPTTALIELLSDPLRYSKLPLTPNSPRSPSNPTEPFSDQLKMIALDQRAILGELTPGQTPPKQTESETVITPSSAPQEVMRTTRTNARGQSMFEKIPYHPDTAPDMLIDNPLPGLVSIAKLSHLKLQALSPENITSAHSDRSGSEFSATETAPSELSAGYEDSMPALTHNVAAERAMLISTPENIVAKKKKKLSFIAELEGSEPVFLPSTVYTPISAMSATTDMGATYELEAPQSYFSLPARPQPQIVNSVSASELSANDDHIEELVKATTPADILIDMTEMISIKIDEAVDEDCKQVSGDTADVTAGPNGQADTVDTKTTLRAAPEAAATQYRLSANIESADDLIHEPAYVLPESPQRSRKLEQGPNNPNFTTQTGEAGSQVPSEKEDVSSAAKEVQTSAGLETIPEISSPTVQSLVTAIELRESGKKAENGSAEHKHVPASATATVTQTTSVKWSEVPQPLKLDTARVVTEGQEDTGSMKRPRTPSAMELIRSNTRDSRQKWKAFFGQRKNSGTGSIKSSSSSIQSREGGGLASPTLSVPESIKTPVVVTTTLANGMSDGDSDRYDAVSKHSRNTSASTVAHAAGTVSVGQQNHMPTPVMAALEDHHSIFDDYV